ncbi:MAG TPA: TonB C-terminal domain-containing protein [Gemmatimonadaceae bacterium]|nr:TonB C-terminal domain-containing protein [Gemmatimonadaceae bacterium]
MSAVADTGRNPAGVTASVVASVLLHGGIIAAFLALRGGPPPASPPIYRVNILAAAPGAPAEGAVAPATVADADAPAPPRPKTDQEVVPVQTKTAPKRAPKLATPNVSKKRVDRNAPAPVAGGGETGGKGTDVANIRTEGIDFPFPGYLENIVRQIALRFRPPRGSSLKAEVMFLIRRDGTVSGFRFTQRSGSFTFDLEAQGAVESAAGAFGPLPDGFHDDVLPVIFSFDPRLIR